jgi:hypothetical protein
MFELDICVPENPTTSVVGASYGRFEAKTPAQKVGRGSSRLANTQFYSFIFTDSKLITVML